MTQNKKYKLTENYDSDFEEEQPKNPSFNRGEFTKPMILKSMTESFDHFRQGMDKLANAYMLMKSLDPELQKKLGRFGEAISKMLDGYAKIIEQQGGTIEPTTKSDGLKQYFGQQGLSALGLNENKNEVFEARVDLNIQKIKHIINNGKPNGK